MWSFSPRWPLGIAAALALISTAAAAAAADESAEAFVTEHANEALRILSDNAVTIEDKKEAFRALVEQVADVPRITRFVLGKFARGIDPDELADFSVVFSDYAIGEYERRLGDYAGETLVVTGSTDRRPGDAVVHTQVSGGRQAEPLPVNWRVLTDDDGAMRVVDVEVYGVWLAINQRDEIVTIIENNRGRVSAATRALQSKIDELEGTG
jgi:phospholipid transport system substrate-binding protein